MFPPKTKTDANCILIWAFIFPYDDNSIFGRFARVADLTYYVVPRAKAKLHDGLIVQPPWK